MLGGQRCSRAVHTHPVRFVQSTISTHLLLSIHAAHHPSRERICTRRRAVLLVQIRQCWARAGRAAADAAGKSSNAAGSRHAHARRTAAPTPVAFLRRRARPIAPSACRPCICAHAAGAAPAAQLHAGRWRLHLHSACSRCICALHAALAVCCCVLVAAARALLAACRSASSRADALLRGPSMQPLSTQHAAPMQHQTAESGSTARHQLAACSMHDAERQTAASSSSSQTAAAASTASAASAA